MLNGPKLSYTKPTLIEYGTVSQLTQNRGMSFLSDSNFTGSMASNPNSMGGMQGMHGMQGMG